MTYDLYFSPAGKNMTPAGMSFGMGQVAWHYYNEGNPSTSFLE